MGIADDYINAIYSERRFYASYPPNTIVELGTFGELQGKRFIPCGRLRDLPNAIALEPDSDGEAVRSKYRNEFSVKGARATRFGAGADVGIAGVTKTVRAALKIEFSGSFGAYIGLAGMEAVAPKNLAEVEKELIRRAQLPTTDTDHFDRKYCIVSHLVKASKATILMSRTKNSHLVLQAKIDALAVDFADASIGFDTLFDNTSVDQFIPEEPAGSVCTPFFSLVKLQFPMLRKPRAVFGMQPRPASSSPNPPAPGPALVPEGHEFDPRSLA